VSDLAERSDVVVLGGILQWLVALSLASSFARIVFLVLCQ
jgi:hypothetical protein